jgi:hypothetical protein
MPIFDRAEIEREFQNYKEVVKRCAASDDWNEYCDLYTEDATLRASGSFKIGGREALRRWYKEVFSQEPLRQLKWYPVIWYMIDESQGWVSAEFQCRMDDPGDGSIHQFSCFSLLRYAGNGLWSYDQDKFDPAEMEAVFESWTEAKKRCDAEIKAEGKVKVKA